MSLSRRRLLAAGSTALLGGAVAAPFVARAQGAQFTYKYANNLPETHPMNMRAKEMAAAIKQETGGAFDLQIFPSSQLGSDPGTHVVPPASQLVDAGSAVSVQLLADDTLLAVGSTGRSPPVLA